MDINEKYTLITGASAGIGKAIAFECAKRKMNLILVALPEPNLELLAKEIENEYPVKTYYYATDLTKKDSPARLHEWCVNNHLSVNILVNNAGIGHMGSFVNSTIDFLDYMMQLNMISVTYLTRLFINELQQHPQSYILNVGSTVSFRPVPYKSVYAATKSYIYSFSRALREELKDTSVHVSCICPGPVLTNGQVRERINSQGIIGRTLTLSAEKVAFLAMDKLLKKQAVIVPGILNKTFLLIGKRIPTVFLQMILAKTFKDRNKNITL